MSDRRRRGEVEKVRLDGSPEEVEYLSGVAAAAVAEAPQLASDFNATLARFVTDTAPARARAMSGFGAAEPRSGGAPARSSRATTAVGTTLLIITLLASPVAALAPLPARADYDIDPQLATVVSAIAAVVCAVAAVLGALLPPWGTQSSNDQTWKTLYAAAVIVGIGMIAGATGLGDVVSVGSPLWLAWFLSSALALGAAVLGAEVRRRRGPATSTAAASVLPPPGSDDEFFASITVRRDRAVREADQLVSAEVEAAQRVDRLWRAGIEAARTNGSISRIAFDSAISMSALRFQLERAAQPEFMSGPT